MILLAGTPPAGMKRASTMWTTVARAPLAERKAQLITSLRGVYSQHRKPAKLRRRLRSTLRRFRVPASGRREVRESVGESNDPVEIAALDALDLLVVVDNES